MSDPQLVELHLDAVLPHEMAEKALRLNTDPARLKQLVQLLDSTRE